MTECPNDDEFDKIIADSGMTDEDADGSLDEWEALVNAVGQHNTGMLVKGFFVGDFMDENGRELRYVLPPGMTHWEVLGIVETIKEDIKAERMAQLFTEDGEDE